MCVAHFACDIWSLIFKTYVHFALWRNGFFLLRVVKLLLSRIVATYYNLILAHNIMGVTHTSQEHHVIFKYDIIFNWFYSCVHLCTSCCPIMEVHLFFVRSNVANIEGVCYFIFTCPNSAIISDSCDFVGSQVCILVEFSFPRIFK